MTDHDRGQIIHDILQERRRAEEKFPGQSLPLGFGPGAYPLPSGNVRSTAAALRDRVRTQTDVRADEGVLTWLDVLLEEAMEAFAEDDPAKARTELVQLAAMCVRAIEDIDTPRPYDFTGPSGAHWRQIGATSDGEPVLVSPAADVTDVDRLVGTQPTWAKAAD